MGLWQRINIFQLPDYPIESQKLNDELFDIYNKLNTLRTLNMGGSKPEKPVEGELWNDGEKINIYLGEGLGPNGDGWVPVSYINPDARYPLLDQYNQDITLITNDISAINTTLDSHDNLITNLDERTTTIETVNIPTINNRLDSHDNTLATHSTQISNNTTLANDAYNRADSAYNLANSAYSKADSAYTLAGSAYDRADSAYNLASSKYGNIRKLYIGNVSSTTSGYTFTISAPAGTRFTGNVYLYVNGTYVSIFPDVISYVTSVSFSTNTFSKNMRGISVKLDSTNTSIIIIVPEESTSVSSRIIAADYTIGLIYADIIEP